MFSKDGNWKEFGIGRSKERYTWMPFWLFAILWAILSYTIVLVIVSNRGSNANNEVNEVNEINEVRNNRGNRRNRKSAMNYDNDAMDAMDAMDTMNNNNEIELESEVKSLKKGYYILNTNTNKNGSPKYIFLGPKAPNLHYEED